MNLHTTREDAVLTTWKIRSLPVSEIKLMSDQALVRPDINAILEKSIKQALHLS